MPAVYGPYKQPGYSWLWWGVILASGISALALTFWAPAP